MGLNHGSNHESSAGPEPRPYSLRLANQQPLLVSRIMMPAHKGCVPLPMASIVLKYEFVPCLSPFNGLLLSTLNVYPFCWSPSACASCSLFKIKRRTRAHIVAKTAMISRGDNKDIFSPWLCVLPCCSQAIY